MTTRAERIRVLQRQLERERERAERAEETAARWTAYAKAARENTIPDLMNRIRELKEKA